jgi:uncharacterized protein
VAKVAAAVMPDHPARPLATGAGLGLRRPLLGALLDSRPPQLSFLEVAPENWIGVGGARGRRFRELTERWPLYAHGLSLSLGGPAPLDDAHLQALKRFLDTHGVLVYSEHLSWCADDGQLYDLMPIPHTPEAVDWVATRIQRVQETLGRRIAIENVSTYAAPGSEMSEAEFITAVLQAADCDLLLDVNNIVVNSINHRYDARSFLEAMPAARVAYIHIAGHYVEADDLRVDTHGSPVPDAAWELLDRAYAHCGAVPTLLERDFNIPPLPELLLEVDRIVAAQRRLAA